MSPSHEHLFSSADYLLQIKAGLMIHSLVLLLPENGSLQVVVLCDPGFGFPSP